VDSTTSLLWWSRCSRADLQNTNRLIGCVPAVAEVGEAGICEIESRHLFADYLGLLPIGFLYFEVVDGPITRHDGHGYAEYQTALNAWQDFVLWVGEKNRDDALALGSFPGDGASAQIAVGYLDDYFTQ
jgi:hypothetical protein